MAIHRPESNGKCEVEIAMMLPCLVLYMEFVYSHVLVHLVILNTNTTLDIACTSRLLVVISTSHLPFSYTIFQ